MNPHDPNGSSTLARRAACPGSLGAELPLWNEPEIEDEDTARGNARHDAGSAGLRDADRRPLLLADLAPDDQQLVATWWGFWDGKVAQAKATADGGVETKLALRGGRSGTCDAWALWRSDADEIVLTVADLKGQPPGRVRWNLQVADYVDGLLLGHLAGVAIDRIEVAIVSRAGVDEHTYGEGELVGLVERIAAIIDAAKAPDAPRRPGEHCTYCRAAATCTERRAVAARVSAWVQLMGDPVAFVSALAPDQRTDLLDNLSLAADRLGAAHDAIKGAIRDGRIEVPGYRATPSTRAEWADPAAARLAVLVAADQKGIAADEIAPLCSVSKARSLLGAEVVDPLTERRPGTPSVRRVKGGGT